jgi:choline dehydrogenase
LIWRIMHHSALAAAWAEPLLSGTQLLDQAAVDSDTAVTDLIRNNCDTLWHPLGTTRMGPEGDRSAVVDQYCRVRGIEGLRVVDASVMPNIVRANTNLTCIMIGERVADWMRNSD